MLSLLVATALTLAPLQNAEVDERPPLGQHMRDVDEIVTAAGVLLDDHGGLWALERQPGRLLRIEPGGERRVLHEGLASPRDLARGLDGELFVSEAFGGRVRRLSAEGASLSTFGEDLLFRPQGLDSRDGRLYVVDRGRHRVEVFDFEGKHLLGFGEHGVGDGQLIEPTDVAVDGKGRLFVTDSGNSRVQAFNAKGEFLHAWGDWGPFPGLFSEPTGIVVRAERVYVADRGNHRVQVFDGAGTLLDRFGLHAIRPREGAGFLHYPEALALSPQGEFAALSEAVVDRVQVFGRTGGTPEDDVRRQAQQLARPSAHYGMDVEIAGPYLAMSEPESHSVVFYENTYTEPRQITRVSGLGSKTGLLTGVGGMDFERGQRDLWVCDPRLRRLSCFRLRGSEEDEVGFDGLMSRFVKSLDLQRLHELEMFETLAGVPEPVALDRDGKGRFYVLDRRNACVLVLTADLHLSHVLGLGILGTPTGIAVSADGKHIDVADGMTGLHRFDDSDAGHRRYEAGEGPELLEAYDVAQAPNGDVFVTDTAAHRVTAYDKEGRWLRSFGSKGLGRGEFYKPRGLAFDHRGYLTVIDHANHRGVTFTPEGEYVSIFGLRLYTKAARYPDLGEEQE